MGARYSAAMLSRFHMKRGAPARELPAGRRVDTRMHTRHILRPERPVVETYLAAPSDAAWKKFRAAYRAAVANRRKADAASFDALADEARAGDVHLGCSCPTAKNPDVRRCHTWLALELMHEWYPDLDVRFPPV